MSFAGTLMTPRIDAKIRSAMLKRKKSNFKDILRERFRDQIRANRRTLFEKMRSLDDSMEVQSTLSDYLRHEMREFDVADLKKRARNQQSSRYNLEEPELDHDVLLELMKEIEVELVNEQYEWIQEQLRVEEEQVISSYESESVICPLCRRGTLYEQTLVDPIACTGCDLLLTSSMSLQNLNRSLKQNVEEHSRSCSGAPEFWHGTGNTLTMTCDLCSCLCSLN